MIDLIELGQYRLDLSEELITLVRKFDPFRVSREKAKLKILFQSFQVFGKGRLAHVQHIRSLGYI
jgi:hypothetical protein